MTPSLRGALVGLAVLVLAGCSSGSDKAGKPTSPATKVGGAPVQGTPLASAIGDFPGGRVDLYQLKRSGASLRLDFGVTNTGTAALPLLSSMQDPGFEDPNARNASGVTLVDTRNAKEYRVLLGSEKTNCRCSNDLGYVDPGASVPLFAEFPVPPDDLKTVYVLVPHYAPMAEVAIGGSGQQSSGAASGIMPSPAATAPGSGATAAVSLEVYDLQRADGFAVLRFGLRNTGTTGFLAGDKFQAPELKVPRIHDFSGLALLDPGAQQKLLPLKDATGYCLCSGAIDFGGELEPGATQVFWAAFPVPAPAATSMQVLVPTFAPVSVAVSGGGR